MSDFDKIVAFEQKFAKKIKKKSDPIFYKSLEIGEKFGMSFREDPSVIQKERILYNHLEAFLEYTKAMGFETFMYLRVMEDLARKNKDNAYFIRSINECTALIKQNMSDKHSININMAYNAALNLELSSHHAFGMIGYPAMHREAFAMFQKNYVKKLCTNMTEVDLLRRNQPFGTTLQKVGENYIVYIEPNFRVWASQKYKPISFTDMIKKYSKREY